MQVHYVLQVLSVQSARGFEFFSVVRSLFATNIYLKSKSHRIYDHRLCGIFFFKCGQFDIDQCAAWQNCWNMNVLLWQGLPVIEAVISEFKVAADHYGRLLCDCRPLLIKSHTAQCLSASVPSWVYYQSTRHKTVCSFCCFNLLSTHHRPSSPKNQGRRAAVISSNYL